MISINLGKLQLVIKHTMFPDSKLLKEYTFSEVRENLRKSNE